MNTLEKISQLYTFTFYDNNWQETSKDNATKLHIGFERSSDNYLYINKTIQATKKEITFEYIMNKINTDAIYVNFCETFQRIINNKNLSCYPTSYGIGIFVALDFRGNSQKYKNEIESILNTYKIEYKNEYSDAGWVFRYKISKSRENINKINNININI